MSFFKKTNSLCKYAVYVKETDRQEDGGGAGGSATCGGWLAGPQHLCGGKRTSFSSKFLLSTLFCTLLCTLFCTLLASVTLLCITSWLAYELMGNSESWDHRPVHHWFFNAGSRDPNAGQHRMQTCTEPLHSANHLSWYSSKEFFKMLVQTYLFWGMGPAHSMVHIPQNNWGNWFFASCGPGYSNSDHRFGSECLHSLSYLDGPSL